MKKVVAKIIAICVLLALGAWGLKKLAKGNGQEAKETLCPTEVGTDSLSLSPLADDSDDAPELDITINDVSFKMIRVEGGTFTMGATPEQGEDADADESPCHNVTLPTYYIAQTEVTQALWQAVMGNNPSDNKAPQNPVECVNWDHCQKFISKLNQLTGRTFRLPSEAEWEFAARGGNLGEGHTYSGSDLPDEVAWFSDNAECETRRVKMLSPNELGLYDMSGNVEEWCQDWYGEYTSSSQTSPTGATSGTARVYRGGGCCSTAKGCRVTSRKKSAPTDFFNALGLRLAL